MTTARAVQAATPGGGVVKWEDYAEDFSEFGLDDIRVSFPVVKLVTGVSKMDGAERHGGEWYHSDREDEPTQFTKALECVILGRRRAYAFFEKGNDKPLCRAFGQANESIGPREEQELWSMQVVDTLKSEGVEVPFASTPAHCADCPFSKWTGEKGETPPLCKESDVFLIDRGRADFAQVRFSGTGLKPMRTWLADHVIRKKIAPFNWGVSLSTHRVTRDGNTWHEIDVEGERLSVEEAQFYAEEFHALKDHFGRADIQDSPDSEAAPVDDGWVEA